MRSWPARHLRPAPAAFQRPVPVFPPHAPAGESAHDEASSRVHLRSPVRPSPACDPRAEQRSSGTSPGFAPRSYPQRTPGRGRSTRTEPGLRRRHKPPSSDASHSPHATSCRTAELRRIRSRRRRYAAPLARRQRRALPLGRPARRTPGQTARPRRSTRLTCHPQAERGTFLVAWLSQPRPAAAAARRACLRGWAGRALTVARRAAAGRAGSPARVASPGAVVERSANLAGKLPGCACEPGGAAGRAGNPGRARHSRPG